MMRILNWRNTGLVCLLGVTFATGCSKEINGKQVETNESNSIALQSAAGDAIVSDTALARFFKAPFSSRGSRTDFRGEISDTTAIVSLDFLIQKKFTAGDGQRLLLDYADGGLSSKGWKYEVILDKKTGTIKLVPNSVMEAQIVPGSFKTVLATFDRFTSTFTFFTEVKESNNSVVHQVTEILTRQ
ncbi:hypothetical protein FRZ67_06830 [Panacibacter ginsenosidivorans]|uniref:Uncharacterized protein n=1 Tax=Panacibacter ginsenosidivorans TaxID=1813871 RepID=A0A5B8V6U5_9BACT|nr:hypothetical protein [Panacibacter ginsenosidivorans]QEC67022.1 hypothetical protein FRZ67_06830 [Panacibacter ginsenosidivorans]